VTKSPTTKRAVDPQAANYQPTRGKFNTERSDASSILRAVDKGGKITQETLTELLDLLRTKTDYHFHVEATDKDCPESMKAMSIDQIRLLNQLHLAAGL